MQNIKTDLAIELREVADRPNDGVVSDEETRGELKITRIKIMDENGERALSRPRGSYITIECGGQNIGSINEEELITALRDELKKLLPSGGTILVCGIGNHNITPDALGPKTAEKILATRHISKELAQSVGLGDLTPVSVISPGVLGQTGIEVGEIIKGIVDRTSPGAVIAIDALAARDIHRLCRTIQLASTGITPGSGVHNARNELSMKTLGVPVISIGVPTVVDMNTLISDMGGNTRQAVPDEMIVTPREIDTVIDSTSQIVAMGINAALQPHISYEDITMLIK